METKDCVEQHTLDSLKFHAVPRARWRNNSDMIAAIELIRNRTLPSVR